MQRIILASGSANRKMLMDALNISYEVISLLEKSGIKIKP